MIIAFTVSLLIALGMGRAASMLSGVAVATEQAVRGNDYPTVQLDGGEVADTTGLAVAPLLSEAYTPAQVAAGGEVLIRTSDDLGIYAAWVLWGGLCAEAPICIEVDPVRWHASTVEHNRAMVAHEWAHVLTARYQAQMTVAEARRFNEPLDLVHRECMADSLAALVLADNGFPPSDGRYRCDEFWGADKAAEMEDLSTALAQTVLAWAS